MDDEHDAIGTAQRRIVDHLKRISPTTTSDLAAALGVSAAAIRPQIADLADRGLVEQQQLPAMGRGRPPVAWSLTALAVDLFPDRHSDLTIELIESLRRALGDDGLDAVLDQRDRDQLENLRQVMRRAGAESVEGRAVELARHRTAQGYMAEVVPDGDDLLLVEHHCPVCAAASSCQQLCRNELELFQAALGDNADVERTQHLLSGDERCVYRIRTTSD